MPVARVTGMHEGRLMSDSPSRQPGDDRSWRVAAWFLIGFAILLAVFVVAIVVGSIGGQ
jgi:hypothetical protein